MYTLKIVYYKHLPCSKIRTACCLTSWSRCLILFYFFTSGLFIFKEFIEKLKAKVKALCAVKPQDPSGSVKLGRTCSQTLSFWIIDSFFWNIHERVHCVFYLKCGILCKPWFDECIYIHTYIHTQFHPELCCITGKMYIETLGPPLIKTNSFYFFRSATTHSCVFSYHSCQTSRNAG